MKYTLIDNEDRSRYEYDINGEYAIAEYVKRDGKTYITHIEVPPDLQNQGIASSLTRDVFEDIEKSGDKLVPVCPYAIAYLKRHPEWQRIC